MCRCVCLCAESLVCPLWQFDCCGVGNSSDIEGFWSEVMFGMIPPSCCNTFAANNTTPCVPRYQFNVVSLSGREMAGISGCGEVALGKVEVVVELKCFSVHVWAGLTVCAGSLYEVS